MFSKEWVYDKIFGLAEDEVSKIRNDFVDDAKEFFRSESIQNEGMIRLTQILRVSLKMTVGDLVNSIMIKKKKYISVKKKTNEKMMEKNTITDDKPMGRDRLGADERRNSGRD